MLFNPYPRKPAQEVVFSKKKKLQSHPTISLNNIQVEKTSYVNTLTANYEYSRSNKENLPFPI